MCHHVSGVQAAGGFGRRWHFSHSPRQQKGCLRRGPAGARCKDKGDQGQRANGLSSEPPRAATPANSGPRPRPRGEGPRTARPPGAQAAPAPSLAGPSWAGPGRPAARRGAGPGGGRRPSCQVPSCCPASVRRSFNVHSSRISGSSRHQLGSDLFLHGGWCDHRGHLTSGSRPGLFWQGWRVDTLFHLHGDSDGPSRPLPSPAF